MVWTNNKDTFLMRILQIWDTEHFEDLLLNDLNKLFLVAERIFASTSYPFWPSRFTFSPTFNPLLMVYSSLRQEHQVFRFDPFLSTLFFRKMNLFLHPLLPLLSFPTVNQLKFLEVIISGWFRWFLARMISLSPSLTWEYKLSGIKND